MCKEKVLSQVMAGGVIGVIRLHDSSDVVAIMNALASGGVRALEITLTTPGAIKELENAAARLDSVALGAGTVLDSPSARQAILAGAQFVVTPTVCPEVIRMARRYGAATIIGAMTPTEALAAWEAGADLVKIFPASVVGSAFVREMRGPLPQVPLVPTGGITPDNAADFIKAGAAAVCAGSSLLDKAAVANRQYGDLTKRAAALVDAVQSAKDGRG